MKRNTAVLLSVAIIAAAGEILPAQNPTASAAFEVASIRPALPPTPETVRSGQFHAGAKVDGAHLDFGYVSVFSLLPYAFGVKPYQISAPSWSRDSMWNILANRPPGTSEDEIPLMMQALLADRFKMSVHHEKRDQPVYELQVAPGGLKVELSTGGDFKRGTAVFQDSLLMLESFEAAPGLRGEYSNNRTADNAGNSCLFRCPPSPTR